jgi:hypothetical protein
MTHAIAKHLYAVQAVTVEGFFKLWDDWLTLAVTAFCRDDAAYMAVMQRYGPRVAGRDHPADHFAHALGEFLRTCQSDSALGTPFPDTLGRIHEEEALTNHYAGQFFTPEPVCQMMAAMIVEPTDEPITICDPACGSGRFFIAAQPRAPKATFTGIDRDLTCVHMTALNMLVRNADACIVHGNTLSMETFGGYVTRRSVFGGEIRSLTAAQASTVLTAAAKAQAEQEPAPMPRNEQPTPDRANSVPESTPRPFTVDRKGQFGFDF